MALPGLIDTILHSCCLKVSAGIVFDVETRVLETETFPQYTINDLNSGITFIVLFSQEKLLQ